MFAKQLSIPASVLKEWKTNMAEITAWEQRWL
jgi:hypothetical protein